jgi:hypothetical protein
MHALRLQLLIITPLPLKICLAITLFLPNCGYRHILVPHRPIDETMCHYYDQKFYYSKCIGDPRHIVKDTKWDECAKAKANGHRCADASPAKGLNGEVLVHGSSKRKGDCPECPPQA